MLNQQIQFNLIAASDATLEFTLSGPNGYVGFQDLKTSSGLLTLPASGNYTLSADGDRRSGRQLLLPASI